MATILHIETSTTVCSAALSHDGRLCLSRVCAEGMSHASKLPVFIDEMLQYCHSHHLPCDAVAVSAGPGSYTGLRIGVSTAKGICYGLNAKLLAIDTLQLTARAALPEIADENALICPMTDARRMEVYTALYDTKLRKVLDCTAKIIDADAFADLLSTHKIYFCGDGSAKCRSTIAHDNAVFLDGIAPLAENMIAPAEAQYAAHAFEDVAYFEPFYLKEFQATKPKAINL